MQRTELTSDNGLSTRGPIPSEETSVSYYVPNAVPLWGYNSPMPQMNKERPRVAIS